MAIRKIIVGYDGSQFSEKALQTGKYLAAALGSTLTTVTVLRAPEFSPSIDEIDESYNHAEKTIRPKLDEIARAGREAGLEIETVVLRGHPAESIVNYAAGIKADLIIMGTRGLGGFKSLIIGSVAQKVVSYSKIPVLVVK